MYGLIVIILLFAIPQSHFAIQVVDDKTGRGVPLIELRIVNDIRLQTDSGGWVAFHEPGLMDREVFFHIEGPGYEYPKDGFGNRGMRLITAPGKSAVVKVKRTNIAERLYRITGQGIYRDSELLDKPHPKAPQDAVTLGQDSVQMMPYRGKLFWLWGDTNLAYYPLGNFHTTAATSPMPGSGFDPRAMVPLEYFMDAKQPGRVRKMMPMTDKEPGPVWLFGLLSMKDDKGEEALLAHYTRRKSLAEQYEHGLARFNDAKGHFERIVKLEDANTWQFPRHNAVRVKEAAGDYFYFAFPFCTSRVKAEWKTVCDPKEYEALVFDDQKQQYVWRHDVEPTTQDHEQRLHVSGQIKHDSMRYELRDAAGQLVRLHRASINWNEYRKKWILIGNQYSARESHLGEIWYAEAESVTGPWKKAVKVAGHPKYSFYNPRHHAVFDEEGGRYIYFEGTYTTTFSGNTSPTPRYEYNQIMYRLDLADERLR